MSVWQSLHANMAQVQRELNSGARAHSCPSMPQMVTCQLLQRRLEGRKNSLLRLLTYNIWSRKVAFYVNTCNLAKFLPYFKMNSHRKGHKCLVNIRAVSHNYSIQAIHFSPKICSGHIYELDNLTNFSYKYSLLNKWLPSRRKKARWFKKPNVTYLLYGKYRR